jgi:putative Ca2+/H+ antiporter (TMEM165/GDT1 family)
MDAFFISCGIVAISEVGDKTQLLSLLLAARFQRPAPIILGILIATIFNHALAGLFGEWAAGLVSPEMLRLVLAVLFIGMGIWALIPDSLDDDDKKVANAATTFGIFWITTVAFFFAEIGDKTQLATAVLAARFDAFISVVAGTTLGMLIADVPAVYLGRVAGTKVQAAWLRYVAAGLFIAMGLATYFSDFILF